MSRWSDFYKDRVGDSYTEYAKKRYEPFINAIASLMRPHYHVLEVGAGIGTISKCLADYQYPLVRFSATDRDPDMISLMHKNLGHRPIHVFDHDMFDPLSVRPDIIHSHGVLEHYPIDKCRALVQALALSGARHMLHYVPGEKYTKRSFGDENLLSAAYWINRVQPDKIIKFNNDYDYILQWDF